MATKQTQVEQIGDSIRRDLGSAYAFVLGQQAIKSFAAVTPEELLDQQIGAIEGAGTAARPNEMTRLANLQTALGTAVDRIKKVPLDTTDGEGKDNTNTTPDDQEEDPAARQARVTGQTA